MKKNIISNLIHETMNKVSKCCGATIIDTEYDVNIHNSHKSFSYKMCSKCHSPQTESGENIIVCPAHGNKKYKISAPHYCKNKIGEGCNCVCTCPQSPNSGEKCLACKSKLDLPITSHSINCPMSDFIVNFPPNSGEKGIRCSVADCNCCLKHKCGCGEQTTIGNADVEIGGVCHRVNNPCYVITPSTKEDWEPEDWFAILKELRDRCAKTLKLDNNTGKAVDYFLQCNVVPPEAFINAITSTRLAEREKWLRLTVGEDKDAEITAEGHGMIKGPAFMEGYLFAKNNLQKQKGRLLQDNSNK